MITFLAVTPHGSEMLEPKDSESEHLRASMIELYKQSIAKKIDVFVLVTPHNIRISDHLGIIFTEYVSGKLGKLKRKYDCDRTLAKRIYKSAKALNLPVVDINFGALEGPESLMMLDWGSLIPLSFLNEDKKVVLITPAREVNNEELMEFGEIVGEVCEKYQKNVGIIISADHAHTHKRTGPYGFSKYAKIYDDLVLNAFESDRIEEIKNMDKKIIEHAKPDSFWQILILIGILKLRNFKPGFIDYQCPSYFGMMVVSFK